MPVKFTAAAVLGPAAHHVPVSLKRLPNAAVLWQPRGESGSGDGRSEASDHELSIVPPASEHFGYVISEPGELQFGSCELTGLADRYGGSGIGHNGGSGRNVFVDGKLLKGVGRTPLVSALTKTSHASGGAYLEECVREAIFAEIVDHDFPYGAVPVLAILDTGIVQEWPPDIDPPRERRTLLVRPAFIRPAHLERAFGFQSSNPIEGASDQRRVRAICESLVSENGVDGFLASLEVFWSRWAHQLAYGFVHRLSHGNNTSSNISLDGRLVDFGAASTVPSWARTATSYFPDPLSIRFDAISSAMRSVYYYVGRYVSESYGETRTIDACTAKCAANFQRLVTMEVLRLCGVADSVAKDCINSKLFGDCWRAAQIAINFGQQEHLDLLLAGEYPDSNWDIRKVWSLRPPSHLQLLASFVKGLVCSSDHGDAMERCHRLSASRPDLYKPNLRARFFLEVETKGVPNLGADPTFVQDFIRRHVEANVRESEPRLRSEAVDASQSSLVIS